MNWECYILFCFLKVWEVGRIYISDLILDFLFVGRFWLLIQSPYSLMVCSDFLLLNSGLVGCVLPGIYFYRLSSFWNIIVHSSPLWSFVVLWYRLFHFWFWILLSWWTQLKVSLFCLAFLKKNQLLTSLIFSITFLVSIYLLIFLISILLLTLGLLGSSLHHSFITLHWKF